MHRGGAPSALHAEGLHPEAPLRVARELGAGVAVLADVESKTRTAGCRRQVSARGAVAPPLEVHVVARGAADARAVRRLQRVHERDVPAHGNQVRAVGARRSRQRSQVRPALAVPAREEPQRAPLLPALLQREHVAALDAHHVPLRGQRERVASAHGRHRVVAATIIPTSNPSPDPMPLPSGPKAMRVFACSTEPRAPGL